MDFNPRRRRRRHHSYRRNPGPVIAGQDTGDLAAMAGGLALTGAVNEQVLKPLTRGFAPGGATSQKLFDVATTAASAVGSGWGIGLANRHVGRKVTSGGMILAMGRLLGTFVPGLGISASVPSFVRFPMLGGGGVPSQPSTAMASASGAVAALPSASQPVALGTIGARSAGF